jgi:hypothetical protein
MASQVENGKAFEWAFASALSRYLSVPLQASPAMEYNKSCFEMKITEQLRERFAANSALIVEHVVERERENRIVKEAVAVHCLPDKAGKTGDVRDILLLSAIGTLGFSCKTNHDAFKHSRLSASIDFVQKWGLGNDVCSETYWNSVKPIFENLRQVRESSNGQARWDQMSDKDSKVYLPILEAFGLEMTRVLSDSEEACKDLISYIVGTYDFYKIMSKSDSVEVQGFNFLGTLSSPQTRYSTKLIGIDTEDGGKSSKTVRLNGGFTFNFRIHNAESRITPSLKFDIRALSLPPVGIYTHHITGR